MYGLDFVFIGKVFLVEFGGLVVCVGFLVVVDDGVEYCLFW